MVAVVRCGGSCELRPRTVEYAGLRTCAAMHACGAGETACGFGCLGCGDCVSACQFGAIRINPETLLPEVDDDKCTACGACTKACPRNIIELRKKGPKNRRVFVSCVNKDKGAVSMKACKASCIGCGKCAKECKFEAITVEQNLSYIDFTKCRLCKKCVEACPTKAIHAVNFPAPKAPTPSDSNKPGAASQTSPTSKTSPTSPTSQTSQTSQTSMPSPSTTPEERKEAQA